MAEGNAPLFTSRYGGVSIAVFEGKFGKTAVVQKSYKKKDSDEWVRSQINLFMNEIPNLKACVDETVTQFKDEIAESSRD